MPPSLEVANWKTKQPYRKLTEYGGGLISGFEATVRNSDNTTAGKLEPGLRTSVQAANGFEYLIQSGLSPERTYTFFWTGTGGVVTFYFSGVVGTALPTGGVTANYTLTPNIRTYPSGYRWDALSVGDSATAISNDGRIVGTQGQRGFLRNADAGLVTIEVPGAVNTRPTGVNSSGVVVGWFDKGDSQSFGFMRRSDGSYATFDVPGASTALTAISDSGEMVGSVTTGSTTQGVRVALVSGALQVTEILPRVPLGVNSAGVFVGTGPPPIYGENSSIHGYLQTRDGNVVSSFPSPCGGSVRSTPFGPLSINDIGDVVSFCSASSSGYAASFLNFFIRLSDGRIATLGTRRPLEASVGPYSANGINGKGQILAIGSITPGAPDQTMLLTPCTSTVSQNLFSALSGRETLSVPVTSGSECHWLAYSDSNWVTLGPTGMGNGILGVTVVANSTASRRTASLTVGGNVLTVTQEGIPCTVTFNSQSTLLGPQGGSGLLGITAPAGCGWTATSSASWITFPNGASGAGSGNLSFAVAPNPGTTLRTGTITVGGNQFLVNEVGAATCTYSIAPFVSEFPASGGSGGFNVLTGTGCTWTVTNTAPWVTFPGNTSGSGNGTVIFTITPNPTMDTRSTQLSIAGTSVGLVQAGNVVPPNGLSFVPVIPCRVADTRLEGGKSGVFGPPLMIQNTTRQFPIPSSGCGIPSGARAYSLNVTVVPSGPLSFVTVWPAGEARPNVSTLNAFEGQVVANAAIVPAGPSGGVSVYSSNDTHLIIDINGYFTQFTAPDTLVFYSLPPCRLADTRTGSGGPGGTFGPPSLLANASRDFDVAQGGCNVPSSARAYVLNFTVVPKGPLSFISAWPTGVQRPLVSTLNSFQGRVLANAAIVPASAAGGISVYASDPTDVIIDINGFFAPPGGSNALRFYTLSPCRILDTRVTAAILGARETRAVPMSTGCGVPGSAQAFSLNATVPPWSLRRTSGSSRFGHSAPPSLLSPR